MNNRPNDESIENVMMADILMDYYRNHAYNLRSCDRTLLAINDWLRGKGKSNSIIHRELAVGQAALASSQC